MSQPLTLISQVIADIPGDFLRISTWPESEDGYTTIDQLITSAPPTKLKPVDRIGRIVVLTSGTTGTPKGARRPTPKGLTTSAAMLDRIPLRTGDRFIVSCCAEFWNLSLAPIAGGGQRTNPVGNGSAGSSR